MDQICGQYSVHCSARVMGASGLCRSITINFNSAVWTGLYIANVIPILENGFGECRYVLHHHTPENFWICAAPEQTLLHSSMIMFLTIMISSYKHGCGQSQPAQFPMSPSCRSPTWAPKPPNVPSEPPEFLIPFMRKPMSRCQLNSPKILRVDMYLYMPTPKSEGRAFFNVETPPAMTDVKHGWR